MNNRIYAAAAACAALLSSQVLAETVPVKGLVDSRIRSAAYNGDEV